MEQIIKLENDWLAANQEKARLTWLYQLWTRDESLGQNCEVELAVLTAKQEALAKELSMARVRYALECVRYDEEELEFFQAEIEEISDAYAEAVDYYKSLSDSLSPEARECLVDWVNIHGYPKGS